MPENFPPHENTVESPARRLDLVTPHDTNELDPLPKALRIDTAGTVVLRAVDSDADVTLNVFAGEQLAVRAKFVRSTGTSATMHAMA